MILQRQPTVFGYQVGQTVDVFVRVADAYGSEKKVWKEGKIVLATSTPIGPRYIVEVDGERIPLQEYELRSYDAAQSVAKSESEIKVVSKGYVDTVLKGN